MKQIIISICEKIIYLCSNENIYHRHGKKKVDIKTATKIWHRFLDLEKRVENLENNGE